MQNSILLVDDEPILVKSLKMILRKENYNVLTATNGYDALKILNESEVQVILSDMRMPEMDGVELLMRVKEKHPAVIRMILSGQSDLEQVFEAVNHGEIYKFLAKPTDAITLKMIIQNAFDHYFLIEEKKNLLIQLNKKNKELEEFNTKLTSLVEEKTAILTARDNILTSFLQEPSITTSWNLAKSEIETLFRFKPIECYALDKNTNEFKSISNSDESLTISHSEKTKLCQNSDSKIADTHALPILHNKEVIGVLTIPWHEYFSDTKKQFQPFLSLLSYLLHSSILENNRNDLEENIDSLLDRL